MRLTPATLSETAAWLAQDDAGLVPVHVVTRGRTPFIELRYTPLAADGVARWMAALAILIGGSLAAFVLRNARLPAFSPALVIGCCGLAWWLLLTPSIVGFAAMAAACWPGANIMDASLPSGRRLAQVRAADQRSYGLGTPERNPV